jgi:hypothetical protein
MCDARAYTHERLTFGSPGFSNRIPAEFAGGAKCSETSSKVLPSVKCLRAAASITDGSIAWIFPSDTRVRRATGFGAAGGLAQGFRVMIDE